MVSGYIWLHYSTSGHNYGGTFLYICPDYYWGPVSSGRRSLRRVGIITVDGSTLEMKKQIDILPVGVFAG